MKRRGLVGLAAAAMLAPAVSFPAVAQAPAAVAEDRRGALAWAARVADWQLAHRGDFRTIPRAGAETRSTRDWQQAAFYIGLTALAERSRDPRYREAVLANGAATGWSLSPRPFHADDQAIAGAYLWAADHGGPSRAREAFRARADAIIAADPRDPLAFVETPSGVDCQRRWCWSDALFMAPPAWFALSRQTGDPRYAAFADREFRASTTYLFDRREGLFHRDSRFFTRRGGDGEKLFWARGNGWVFAGLTRILDILPARDPRRGYYVALFRTMAKRLIALQKADGYWAPSLLATGTTPPESSGTGFFVHGLAWGVNNGLLDRRATLPAVRRGWAALQRAVQPDGMVGWVQQVSDRPEAVAAADTQYYGVGAFLLAATAVADLERRKLVTVAPAEPAVIETQRVYLSGHGPDDAVPWRFTIDKGARAGEAATIAVPSNWQQQGFGHYQYGYDRGPRSDDHGVYRRSFDVPAAWTGKSIRLVFDGVMTDTLVRVNGTVAGPVHQGGFNRFALDIGALVKPGPNELEVAVSEASAAKDTDIAERWGDYWALSGIYRPVWLEVAPPESIAHVAVDAKASGDIAVRATLAAPRTVTRLVAQVRTRDGSPVGAPFEAAIPAGGSGRVTWSGHVDAPRPWTAETPDLYDIDVTLWTADAPVHRVRTRFGFRTFEVRDGDGLYLNGQRILLKGVNRHSFRPETGRALSRADAYADVALIRSLNMNAVRLSHYSAEESFLEAADELGLYVVDELTGWQHAHDTEVGRKLVRELVERDVDHPSILFWTNGNEGGWNRALDGDFALHDPQGRRVLHPWELYGGVDTKHYPRYPDLVRRLSGTALVMPTEFLHGLYDGGGGSGLDDYWKAIAASPRGAGGFLWNLADEGIARRDRGGAIDVAATLAPDGILGPNGAWEPSAFTVRDIWSPVEVADPVIDAGFDGRLRVTNGFDFTALDGISFDWRWLRFPGAGEAGGTTRTLASGSVSGAAIPPHAAGIVALPLPARRKDADALALVVRQGERQLLSRVWPVTPAPARPIAAATRRATPRIEWTDGAIRLVAGAATASFDAKTGLLTGFRRGGIAAAIGAGPRLVFARPPADKAEPAFVATTAAGDGVYRPAAPAMASVLDVDTGMTAEDGWGGFTLQVSADGAHWTTVFAGARTARDGTLYPFAPQRVAAVRVIDLTGVRRPPAVRAVRIGYEAGRFPDAAPSTPITVETGVDRSGAWIEAAGAGGLDRVRWTLDASGTLALDYRYRLAGPMLYHGIGFDVPGGIASATGLLRGPWPVWQNRLRGPTLGVHRIAATGVAGLPSPTEAGYFADPRWLRLDGGGATLAVRNEGATPFLQLGARRADLPSTSVDFPHADLGFLAAIPAMGAKFQPADTTGPAGQPSVATGEYRGRLLFDLMPVARPR